MYTQKKFLIYSIILTILISSFSSLAIYLLLAKWEQPKISEKNKISSVNYNLSETEENTTQIEEVKNNIKNLESSVKYLANKISPSVVSIVISKDVMTYRSNPYWFFYEPSWVVKKKVWWGTWFFVNKDGIILTNKHVVWDPNATYSVITSQWEEYIGKVLAIDPTTDLAIIKALSKEWENINETPFLKFSDESKKTEVGSFVIAIGNALAEFQNTVTFWVISWIWRSIEAWDRNSQSSEQLTWLIQTDAAINPGNSWWPLVNLDEEVLWINTAIAAGANWLWFAIPLNQREVDNLVSSAVKYGKIKRSYIWIRYIPLNENIAKSLDLKITHWDYIWGWLNQESVIPNWPADKAWIKSWDTITEVNWTELKSWISIKDVIKNKIPWDKISLKIFTKEWEEKIIELVLGEF